METTILKVTKRRDKDPTFSDPLIKRWFAEISRRFNSLSQAVIQYIYTDNRLGGKEETSGPLDITSLAARKYVYEHSPDKAKEFMDWLDQQVADGIMEVEKRPWMVGQGYSLWTDTYVHSAYQKGILQARTDLNNGGAKLPDLGPVSAAMNKPFHADRLGLVYSRVFNGMKGLTEQMKGQMSQVLALGMADGRSPYDIAYKLKDRVDAIGITRARLIARTEVIHAHNEAALNEFDSLEGIVGETIYVQWWTALDDRVRPTHAARHGRVYRRDKAKQLIGEPNCRCALLPWTKTLAEARKGKLGVPGALDEEEYKKVKELGDKEFNDAVKKVRKAGSVVQAEIKVGLIETVIPPDQLDSKIVDKVVAAIKAGKEMNPLVIGPSGTLLDGNHRLAAYIRLYGKEFEAKVITTEKVFYDITAKSSKSMPLGKSGIPKSTGKPALPPVVFDKKQAAILKKYGITEDSLNVSRSLKQEVARLSREFDFTFLVDSGYQANRDYTFSAQLFPTKRPGVLGTIKRKIDTGGRKWKEDATLFIEPTLYKQAVRGEAFSIGGKLIGSTWETAFRHEFGHIFQTRWSPAGKWEAVSSKAASLQRELTTIFAKKGKAQITKEVSMYAATNPEELFAEAFSIWTSPDYGKSKIKLPADLEAFFKKVLPRRK